MSSDISARLVGPLSIDRYVSPGIGSPGTRSSVDERPGGGALNMAYHWAQHGIDFEVISRIATRRRSLFEDFFGHHQIAHTPDLVASGEPCTIDVRFAPDRQPEMDNFVEGVLADFRLTDDEAGRVTASTTTHFVLVDVVDHELHRLAADGRLVGATLSGDFLSLRHFTPVRFAATMQYLDLGFIGWPGEPSDNALETLADIAELTDSLLVTTFGSQGIRTIDGRTNTRRERWFDVDALPVEGTTVGCGDAFIAGFLAEWMTDPRVDKAVDAGRKLGAAATTWFGPLPDSAYSPLRDTGDSPLRDTGYSPPRDTGYG